MGARPIASLDSLRFGPLDDPKHRMLLRGVVHGIGGYGNSVGVATVGGETSFHECYRGNILVNAFNLGLVEADEIFLGQATGRRQSGDLRRLEDRPRRHPRREPARVRRVRRGQRREAPDRAGRRSLHREVPDRGVSRGDAHRRDRRHPGHGRGRAHLLVVRDGEPRRHRHRDGSRSRAAARRESLALRAAALREPGAHAARDARGRRAGRARHLRATGISTPSWSVASPATAACSVRWHGETVVDIPVDPVAANAPLYDRPRRVPADLGERQKLDLASIEPEIRSAGRAAGAARFAEPRARRRGSGASTTRSCRATRCSVPAATPRSCA